MATESDNRISSLAATPPAEYPIARHRTHSKQLMEAAKELVREGKRIRGSNAAWGAMAHTLKSIGRERGMTFRRHDNASNLLNDLIKGDKSAEADAIRAGFNTADLLHQNFYKDGRNKSVLAEDLGMVERAIDLLFERHDNWKRQNHRKTTLHYSIGSKRQPDLSRQEVQEQLAGRRSQPTGTRPRANPFRRSRGRL